MTTQEIYKSIPRKSWKWEENSASKQLLGIVKDKKYCLAYVPKVARITTSVVIYSPRAYPKEYTMFSREMNDASDRASRGNFIVYHFENSLPLSIINSIVRLTLRKQLGK
jgi:hypothetical protein